MKYVAEVLTDDNGEPILEMPVKSLAQMGWDEFTLLQWILEEEECQE